MLKCFSCSDSIGSFERSKQSSLYTALGRIFLLLCITNQRPGWSIIHTATGFYLTFCSNISRPSNIKHYDHPALNAFKRNYENWEEIESVLSIEMKKSSRSVSYNPGCIMGASQGARSRDSRVVSALTHLRRYLTWINWYYTCACLVSPVETGGVKPKLPTLSPSVTAGRFLQHTPVCD